MPRAGHSNNNFFADGERRATDQLEAIAKGLAAPIADSALASITLAQLLATHRGIDAQRLSSQLRRAAKRAHAKQRETLAIVLGAMAKQVARKAKR